MTGFLLPKLACHLLYEVRRSRLWRLWQAGVFGMTVLLIAILSSLTNGMTAVLAVAGLAVLALTVKVEVRRAQFARMRLQARQRTQEAQACQSPGAFTAWADLPVDAATRQAVEAVRGSAPDEEIVLRDAALIREGLRSRSVRASEFTAKRFR